MPLDRVINLLPFYLILKQQLNLLVFQSLGPRRTGVHFNFLNIYLFIILFNTNLDLVNDQENTSLYDTFVDSCFTNPKNIRVLYRKQAEGDQKAHKHWLLRSISLKEQLSRKQYSHVPTQKRMVHHHNTKSFFRTASPTKSLVYFRTRKYNQRENLENITGEQIFPTGSTLEAGKEVSSDGVTEVLQYFVQHSSYTPDTYFQLVMINKQAPEMFTSKDRIRILCSNKPGDKLTQPRLYVEWS